MASIRQAWHNPLARAADRAEATAMLLLAALWLCTLPVAAVVGSIVWHHVSIIAEDQQDSVSSTTAQLLENAAPITIDAQGIVNYELVRVSARWVALDGSERIGPVWTEAGGRSGERIEIWVDRAGDAVNPPVNATASAVLIVTSTIGVALLWGVLLVIAQYLYRGRLDRRRIADWGNDWLRVEPLWSGRSRGGGAQS